MNVEGIGNWELEIGHFSPSPTLPLSPSPTLPLSLTN